VPVNEETDLLRIDAQASGLYADTPVMATSRWRSGHQSSSARDTLFFVPNVTPPWSGALRPHQREPPSRGQNEATMRAASHMVASWCAVVRPPGQAVCLQPILRRRCIPFASWLGLGQMLTEHGFEVTGPVTRLPYDLVDGTGGATTLCSGRTTPITSRFELQTPAQVRGALASVESPRWE
jgi:hypothetical protein